MTEITLIDDKQEIKLIVDPVKLAAGSEYFRAYFQWTSKSILKNQVGCEQRKPIRVDYLYAAKIVISNLQGVKQLVPDTSLYLEIMLERLYFNVPIFISPELTIPEYDYELFRYLCNLIGDNIKTYRLAAKYLPPDYDLSLLSIKTRQNMLKYGYDTRLMINFGSEIHIFSDSGELIKKIELNEEHAYPIFAITNDQTKMLCNTDGIDIYDLTTVEGTIKKMWCNYPAFILITPDDKHVITCDYDGFIEILDLVSTERFHMLFYDSDVTCATLSIIGKYVAFGFESGDIYITDVKTYATHFIIHTNKRVDALLMYNNNIITLNNKDINIWNIQGKLLKTYKNKTSIVSINIFAGNIILADWKHIKIWDYKINKIIKIINKPKNSGTGDISEMHISKDETQLFMHVNNKVFIYDLVNEKWRTLEFEKNIKTMKLMIVDNASTMKLKQ